jgi:predicted dienelactone hydrolase
VIAEARGIGERTASYVDATRAIKPSNGFSGSKDRRIDVLIWYPTDEAGTEPATDAPVASGGPRPLVIYSHGTFGTPDNAKYLVRALAAAGYIVAAPTYPLTSSAAFTKVTAPDVSDVGEQVKDLAFVITSLLADPALKGAIDPDRIGATGHSLGGVTSYFATYGARIRDPRIIAVAPIGAGDPVQAALTGQMGLDRTGHAAVPVPVLFLSAEHDVFARSTGRPRAAFSRVEPPRYEVLVKGGTHVWFREGADLRAPGGRNPDCVFFDRWLPGVPIPGCESPAGGLIDPARQHAITRTALLAFFDGYLKGDAEGIARLQRIAGQFAEAELVMQAP